MIDRPAARYGRQRLSRRGRHWIAIGLALLALAVGVAIAVIAWMLAHATMREVTVLGIVLAVGSGLYWLQYILRAHKPEAD